MKLELPPQICSRTDLRNLTEEVRTYNKWLTQNSIKKKFKSVKPEDRPTLSEASRELIRDWSIRKPLTLASLAELIEALVNFDKEASELTMTLAAAPGNSLKKKLVAWCRQNISTDLLVNFEFNSTILGGLVLRYQSSIFDWSYRRKLIENNDKFTKALLNVR